MSIESQLYSGDSLQVVRQVMNYDELCEREQLPYPSMLIGAENLSTAQLAILTTTRTVAIVNGERPAKLDYDYGAYGRYPGYIRLDGENYSLSSDLADIFSASPIDHNCQSGRKAVSLLAADNGPHLQAVFGLPKDLFAGDGSIASVHYHSLHQLCLPGNHSVFTSRLMRDLGVMGVELMGELDWAGFIDETITDAGYVDTFIGAVYGPDRFSANRDEDSNAFGFGDESTTGAIPDAFGIVASQILMSHDRGIREVPFIADEYLMSALRDEGSLRRFNNVLRVMKNSSMITKLVAIDVSGIGELVSPHIHSDVSQYDLIVNHQDKSERIVPIAPENYHAPLTVIT